MRKEKHMKRRLKRGLAASLFAVITAIMITVLPVSASFWYNGSSYGGVRQYPSNIYATENVFGNGSYWYPNIEAYYEFNSNSPVSTKKPIHAYSSANSYFDYTLGDYVPDNNLDSPYVYHIDRYISDTEGDEVAWRGNSGDFYPTQSMAQEAGVSGVSLRKYEHRGEGNYFNKATGRYYSQLADCVAASSSVYDVLIKWENRWFDRNYTETFKNVRTGKFYLTEAEAKAADPVGKIQRHLTSTQGYYFNQGTGAFYMFASVAAAHSVESDVVRATSFSFTNGVMDSFGISGVYTGMPTYIPAGGDTGYGAPAGVAPSGSTPSTLPASVSPYDENSTATLRSNVSYRGWIAIADLIDTFSAGANVTILMNQDTYVSSTFMKAVLGRDINITLINANGSQIRFNGMDVYIAKDMPVMVSYGTSAVPVAEYQRTVRAAGADSASSFTVGTEGDLGAVVKVTVRFSSSRNGDKAELYLYSSAKNTTSLVDSKIIGDEGLAIFEIRNGGSYIACIEDR
jgi:hypothetical protein